MSNTDGGPAFPRIDGLEPRGMAGFDVVAADGMTLRDYFAAKAMAAMIGTAGAPCLGGLDGYEPHTAIAAYRMADAMLKIREE